MDEDALTCRYVFTAEEYRRFLAGFWRNSRAYWVLFGVLAAIFAFLVYTAGFPSTAPAEGAPSPAWGSEPSNFIPVAIFAGLVIYTFVVRPGRAFRLGPVFNRELVYAFDETEVRMRSPLLDVSARWEGIKAAVETRSGFYIFLSGRNYQLFWIPKNGIASAEMVGRLRALFRARVKKAKLLAA